MTPHEAAPRREPSCYAAALILANRESGGSLLRELQAIESPTYGELLAKNLIENEHAWKEHELWAK